MVVRKIPKKQETFIKGKLGTADQQKKLPKFRKFHNVLVRIPEEMLQKIEKQIEEMPVKSSRNTWILEAINSHFE